MPECDIGGEGKAAEKDADTIAPTQAGKRGDLVTAYTREEPHRGYGEGQPVEAGSERGEIREPGKDRRKTDRNTGTQQGQERQRRGARRHLISNCHEDGQ